MWVHVKSGQSDCCSDLCLTFSSADKEKKKKKKVCVCGGTKNQTNKKQEKRESWRDGRTIPASINILYAIPN